MAIREENSKGSSDARSVALGPSRTAGLITSAALIMVRLFGSFTREAASPMTPSPDPGPADFRLTLT